MNKTIKISISKVRSRDTGLLTAKYRIFWCANTVLCSYCPSIKWTEEFSSLKFVLFSAPSCRFVIERIWAARVQLESFEKPWSVSWEYPDLLKGIRVGSVCWRERERERERETLASFFGKLRVRKIVPHWKFEHPHKLKKEDAMKV